MYFIAFIPSVKCQQAKTFYYNAIKDWQMLQVALNSTQNHNIFKSGVKDFSVFVRKKWITMSWFIVFNATFSNIPAISRRPVLVVEEAGAPRENHRPWPSNS